MADEVIDGIKRRLRGEDSDSGSDYVMERLLKQHGLPLPEDSGRNPDAIAMQMELFELIERQSDAGEAGLEKQVALIGRQIDAVIERAKARFGKR